MDFEWTEKLAQEKLVRHLNPFVNRCFPNVSFGGGEADLLVVTKARRAWEVEIKLTASDWRADARKAKWAAPARKHVSRFYYAAPTALIGDPPDFVPATAGLIELTDYGGLRFRRSAELLPDTLKVSDRQMLRLFDSTYFRFWNWRLNSS